MTKKPKPEPDDKEQSQRFIDTANQLEVDKSGEEFERALKIVTPEAGQDRRSENKSTA